MSLTIVCPVCATRLTVGDDRAGATFECPRCDAAISIPLPASPPPAPLVPESRGDEGDEEDERLFTLHIELRLVQHFDHPGIVRLAAEYLDTRIPFLQYEFIDGFDLSKVLLRLT